MERGSSSGMPDQAELLRARTKQFALRVMRLCRTLPHTDEGHVIGRQLLRSSTSVAANYRAMCRARSRPEFIAKLGVVVEEMDEVVFWLELLTEGGIVPAAKIGPLSREAGELLAIVTAAQRTARSNVRSNPQILKSSNRQI